MATSLTQHPQLMSMRSGKALGKLRRPFHRRDIPAVDLYADRALLLAEKHFLLRLAGPADESVRVDKFRVDNIRPHPLADRPERVIRHVLHGREEYPLVQFDVADFHT